MPDYFRIASSTWDDELRKVRLAAGSDGLAVALYLRTCKVASPFGLYHLPFPVISHYTSVPEARLAEVLTILERVGFCSYDQVLEVVWVPSMAADNVDAIPIPEEGKKPDKRMVWAQKEIARLSTLPFFHDLIARYGGKFHVQHLRPVVVPEAPSPGEADQQKPLARGFVEQERPSDGQPATQHNGNTSAAATSPATETAAGAGETAGDRWQQHLDAQARIRSIFDAVCQGLGLLTLPWAIEREYQMREILKLNPAGPDEVREVAAFFRANMPPGSQPSFDSFCRKYGERRAQFEASKLPPPKPGSVPGALFTGSEGGLCDGHRRDPQHAGTNCRLCMECARRQPQKNLTAAYWAAVQAEQARP